MIFMINILDNCNIKKIKIFHLDYLIKNFFNIQLF